MKFFVKDSADLKVTLKRILRFQGDREIGSQSRGLIEAAEILMTPQDASQKRLLAPTFYKGIS
jgi:hypothetical protein